LTSADIKHAHAKSARNAATPLPRWQRLSVYGLSVALLITGLAWLYLEHYVRSEAEFGPEHHPMQHLTLVWHGVLAMPMLWLSGVLWTAHIKRHWRYRLNRSSGVALLIVLIVLSASAAGLYYLSDEQTRTVVSWLHWIVGVLAGFVLVLHVGLGRRR
jgi:uncharacterized membrane protein